MFIMGAAYASVIADISSFIGDSPEYMTIIGVPVEMLDILPMAEQEKLIVDSFGTFVTLMMTLVCIVPLLNAAMKVRSEEREGRAEHILARAVPRCKYMAGYVVLAYAASIVIQFATAAGLYITAAAMTGDANPFTFGGIVKAFFAFLPALWIMIGVAVLIVGVLPKATGAVWGYFGVVTFTSFVGRLVLPEWMMNITPLHFVSQPEPFQEFVIDFTPLIVMAAIAAALTTAGVIFYRKRDVVW
jgi:ABC-2 type transport system permease protein